MLYGGRTLRSSHFSFSVIHLVRPGSNSTKYSSFFSGTSYVRGHETTLLIDGSVFCTISTAEGMYKACAGRRTTANRQEVKADFMLQ